MTPDRRQQAGHVRLRRGLRGVYCSLQEIAGHARRLILSLYVRRHDLVNRLRL
jgi:hypothetical protein